MKSLLAGVVLAVSVVGAVPASAQSIGIGPDGPRIDLRSRAQRERDYRRAAERDYDRREMYRRDRYDDERRMERRRLRRNYEY